MVTRAPAVSIGLPVHNGSDYLVEAIDGLLGQTWTDFELLISDNASTDQTEEICRHYAAADDRVVYQRLEENIGAAPNHNRVAHLATGRYFKWASHDDLYAPTLVERCLEALREHPEAVLAHCQDAMASADGLTSRPLPYRLRTEDPSPVVRLRSLLMVPGGNDFYGLIRTEVLRRVPAHNSYYNADRTFMAGLVLQGRFLHVPEVLYFRRDHPDRASRAPDRRARAAVLAPVRANRWRHPMPKMYAEYVWGFVAAIRASPLPRSQKAAALAEVGRWFGSCFDPRRQREAPDS